MDRKLKLSLAAVAAACVLGLTAVAAPALTTTRWHPAPRDFELRPAAGSVLSLASAAGGQISRPLRPGKRFNLVGLRWRGRAKPVIRIRTRRTGGHWSHWTRLAGDTDDGPDPGGREPAARGVSAPAWVGQADYVQYRTSRRVPGLRLHFVNVEGTATAADRLRTRLRRVASSAVVSVAGLFGGGTARAAGSQPAIVPREDWGADSCPPRSAPQYGTVKAALVHHTVNPNDYSRAEAPDVVLAICRYHRNSNGWNDIGYNFLVDRFGTIYEGRAGGIDHPVLGAQAQGFNSRTTGIASIGDHREVAEPQPALEAIARLIRWKLPLSGVPTTGSVSVTSSGGTTVRIKRISGHRDVNSTDCPGDALYAQLPQLRTLVGTVGAGPAPPTLEAQLSTTSVAYGKQALLGGTLTAPSGLPLGARALLVQVKRGSRWRTADSIRTDLLGRFAAPLRPHASRRVRARFQGDAGLPATSSRSLLLKVKPRITLAGVHSSGRRGHRLRLRGRVKPGKKVVWQVLQVRHRGRWRTAGVKQLSVKQGRFRGSFVPAGRGRYRVYVVSRADRTTARSRSARKGIRVRG